MLVPIEDKTFKAETTDVEFLLYGGQNRVFTVHRDNLIKLWTFPLYSGETRSNNLERLSPDKRLNDRLCVEDRPTTADRLSSKSNSSDRLPSEDGPNFYQSPSREDRLNFQDRQILEDGLNTNNRFPSEDKPTLQDRTNFQERYLEDRHQTQERPSFGDRPNASQYTSHEDSKHSTDCFPHRVSTGSHPSLNRKNDSDARLYGVFIAEGTVRNIHVVRRGPRDTFLTCEFSEAGNHVTEWEVGTGRSVKIKGLSSSYQESQVRIISVLYLSSRSLAVLVSEEGIVHTIDIWNPHTGVCTHRQIYKAYLPVQSIYNIQGYLLVQPWSSMAEIIVYQVTDEAYHKVDTGTLLTAPPNNIATYRCIVSEDTGHIIAGGSTLKIFHLTPSGRIKYLRSVDLQISGKLLDVVVLHSSVLRLLIVDNSGVCVYNAERQVCNRIACEFKHRNRDILVRADSGFTYRPYLFLPDNGILVIQDTYANAFYKYQIPLIAYVPRPYAEIRKNARILSQYHSVSRSLPAEMWLDVLSYTGYLYSRSFARKIASNFFCRPCS